MKKEIVKTIAKAVFGGIVSAGGTIFMNIAAKECSALVMEAAKKVIDNNK